MCVVEGRLKNIKNLAKNTSLIPFRREELWQEKKKKEKKFATPAQNSPRSREAFLVVK